MHIYISCIHLLLVTVPRSLELTGRLGFEKPFCVCVCVCVFVCVCVCVRESVYI